MFNKNHHSTKIDEASFKKLHQLYSGIIYNYLLKLSGNSFLAEEITQETFIKFWNKRETLDKITNYKAYLFTIAKNLLLDDFNKQKQSKVLSIDSTSENYHLRTPQMLMEEQELEEVQLQAINNLKGVAKEVFILSREQSLTYMEISKVLGISRVAVKKQMMKALFDLRQKLHPHLNIKLIFLILTSLSLFFAK